MDPEQTFIRVQERFSQMLTPKVRAALEYIYLFIAITLFCVLVVMHANYVQQPGCSSELSGIETTEAQLIQIKITSAGLWLQNGSDSNVTDFPSVETATTTVEVANVDEDELTFSASNFWLNWIGSNARKGKLALKFWKTDSELGDQAESSGNSQSSRSRADGAVVKTDKEELRNFPLSGKETIKAAIINFGKKWYKRLSFFWRHTMQILGSFQKLWNISGVHLNLDVPKWLQILYLDRINAYAVQWLEDRSKVFEPTYLYTMEKGYFLLPESARSQHNIRTVNISISARHSCFGNRWQQLLINRFVGYDTILMNSLLNSPGQAAMGILEFGKVKLGERTWNFNWIFDWLDPCYLFNYQTKEFYNLSYAHEPPEGPAKFGGLICFALFLLL
ncbi:hypothetical protein Patl1_36857 [Pistacia atlantica]|nr:hypothetical protein Patl1_36857 [Pistacia atlantica]